MTAPNWRSDLDDVLGSVQRLNDSLRAIDRDQAATVAGQLRKANFTIWSMVNELEAGHQAYLWDVGGMIAAIEAAHDEDDLELSSIFVTLANDGILKVADKKLVDKAKRYGLDPDDYLKHPHPQGDET